MTQASRTNHSGTRIPSSSRGEVSQGIEAAIRQELGMQSNRLLDTTCERVESSIERLRFRATVGDVAAATGLKLNEAEDALKALAFDSQAVLQVWHGRGQASKWLF